MIDFLQHYWPQSQDVSYERVQELRAAAEALLDAAGLDADTTPGTPFGDLHLTPAAWDRAATEIAWQRFASDLDPENARQGTVWNCEFVRAYLDAFGQEGVEAHSWTILQLVFSSTNPVTIDRSTLFRINQQDFRIQPGLPGPLYLNSPTPLAGENHRQTTRIGNTRWAVSLLAFGPPGVVSDATTAQVDREIEGLVRAATVGPVYGGTAPSALQEQARRLRTVFNSRQPVTRGGAAGMVRTRFPEIDSVYAVLSGDFEQARDLTNFMRLPSGKVDVLAKGPELFEETMSVRLRRYGTAAPFFGGVIKFTGIPVKFGNVTLGGQPVVHEFTSFSQDPESPLLSASYSKAEEFYLRIDAANIPGKFDGQNLVEDFAITWQHDPELMAVSEWMEQDSNRAAGVTLRARWFLPYRISKLDVWYNRKSGVVFDQEKARAELLDSFNRHYPESPAGSHSVGDILFWAGAHSVHRIEIEADCFPSPAHKVWLGQGIPNPVGDGSLIAFLDNSVNVPSKKITSLLNLDPGFSHDPTLVRVGPRNFSWYLETRNLRLIERDVI